ncbi:MAG TPA: TolC family protein, partial [Acidobacteriota bacterium]|nr:TolC family protein [Acidobacteriota bacterium]
GTMAPLEIVVAEAEVAAREEGIILAEAAIGNIGDRLKVLVFGATEPAKWSRDLFPTDEPRIREIAVDEEEAISRALAGNPDIKALESDLESNKLNAKLAANTLKPQLDLRGSVGYQGLGGDGLLLDDNFPPNIIGTLPGGYTDALDSLFDNRTWSVGFLVGIPIGNGAAEAGYIRADLTQKQAAKALENAKQQLALNVRTTLRNLQSDAKRLDAARASRVLQEKKLDAEKKKLNVGLSTNFIVLDFQEDLTSAQSAELRALVAYNKNYAQLQRYMGNSLQ